MCVGGDMGISLNLDKKNRLDYLLFNETAGVFVVELENDKIAKKIFKDLPFRSIGKTKKEKRINIVFNKKEISANLYELKRAWKKPMEEIFN
jgi:phosphoribosylformylglycinamidine synthase